MLSIRILCIGRLKESYWKDACAEYAKRLSAFCRFSIVELPECRLPESPSQGQINAALEEEGERLLREAGRNSLCALCVEGKSLSSERLAATISEYGVRGTSAIDFVIGSSYGLSRHVKSAAVLCLSMSSMTFPHQLARVMLCEQIYRSFQINANGKYHK